MFWKFPGIATFFTTGMVLFTTPWGKWKGTVPDRRVVERAPYARSISRVKRERPSATCQYIYMSFDDGPSQGSRAVNALSLCDSLPVDVFIIGRNAGLTERSRALLGAYRENPFVEIGNHSYSHANHHYDKFFRDADTVLIDVNRSRDFLHLNNGLVRLPGRNFFRLGKARRNDRNNGKEAADKLADNGYRVFGWDLEWRRISSSGISVHSAAEMLEIVTSMLDDGKTFLPNQIVLLLHDRDLRDARFELQVREFVRLARAEGRYRFAHLGEMRSDDSP